MKIRAKMSSFIVPSSEANIREYLRDIYKIPILTPEEEFEYAMKAVKGDKESLDMLIKSNLRFVVSVAKQSLDGSVKLCDLINEGNIGLIIAANKYDPTKGFKFISYAIWWIRQKINEYKDINSRVIRLPTHKVSDVRKMISKTSDFEHKYYREPTVGELSEMFNINEHDILTMFNACTVMSYDRTYTNNDDNECFVNTLSSDYCTDSLLLYNDSKKVFGDLLDTLKDRDMKILRLYYGLDTGKRFTLSEIGDILNITSEAVRLSRDKAIKRLKVNMQRFNIQPSDIYI